MFKIYTHKKIVFEGKDENQAIKNYIDFHVEKEIKPSAISSIKTEDEEYTEKEIKDLFECLSEQIEEQILENNSYEESEGLIIAKEEASELLGFRL